MARVDEGEVSQLVEPSVGALVAWCWVKCQFLEMIPMVNIPKIVKRDDDVCPLRTNPPKSEGSLFLMVGLVQVRSFNGDLNIGGLAPWLVAFDPKEEMIKGAAIEVSKIFFKVEASTAERRALRREVYLKRLAVIAIRQTGRDGAEFRPYLGGVEAPALDFMIGRHQPGFVEGGQCGRFEVAGPRSDGYHRDDDEEEGQSGMDSPNPGSWRDYFH